MFRANLLTFLVCPFGMDHHIRTLPLFRPAYWHDGIWIDRPKRSHNHHVPHPIILGSCGLQAPVHTICLGTWLRLRCRSDLQSQMETTPRYGTHFSMRLSSILLDVHRNEKQSASCKCCWRFRCRPLLSPLLKAVPRYCCNKHASSYLLSGTWRSCIIRITCRRCAIISTDR